MLKSLLKTVAKHQVKSGVGKQVLNQVFEQGVSALRGASHTSGQSTDTGNELIDKLNRLCQDGLPDGEYPVYLSKTTVLVTIRQGGIVALKQY
ncbi:hypothetical protein ACFOEE_06275 [Pseudoalteromonas fenneropenaei]|uniref:DUF4258 domain-containing protein n=1 Tax=Pseudoalteromonas fenneropenaei TaxID=1737459 RepID=A0ABV7CHP0_9GAMM